MRRGLITLFTLTLVGLTHTAFAQSAFFDKMEVALEDGSYQRVLKVGEDAFEDKEAKKEAAVYFMYAKACIELSNDEVYFAKNPDIAKMGVKAAIKGKSRDEDGSVAEEYSNYLDDVADRYNELADKYYNINKSSKALKMYDNAYKVNGNRYSYMMTGKCAIETLDSTRGEKIYNDLIQQYNNDPDSKKDAVISTDPFVYFIDKYYMNKQYDSASQFITNGRVINGDDAKFDFFQKAITLEQIKGMPPSSMMLDRIQEAIAYNAADKELLHKENAIYVYLIKNAILNKQTVQADTLVNKFMREKVAKSSHKQVNKIKLVDEFVDKKPENVLWKLSEYYQTYGHTTAGNYLLDKYMTTTAKSTSSSDVADRWSVITQYAYDTKSFPFAAFILQRAISKYPSTSSLKDLRKKMIVDKENIRTNASEQAAVYSLMKDHFGTGADKETKERIVKANEKLIGLLTGANRFPEAMGVFEELKTMTPGVDQSFRLEQMAKDDFYNNYFLTKTKGRDQSGRNKTTYKWSGDPSGCEEGKIDEAIQLKVKNRINYFRRNAGIPEVLFDEATNEYCQKAALMMTSNNNLSHEPPRTWRCYSDEGAYAAKHSLIIKDAHTSMGVTYIMADKNNPSAGNRRWLLYPNGQIYGHGSTDDVTVIWALDDSGSTDTAIYMDKPICWPPNGYVPQMMLFETWTFGLYRNLEGAKVSVTLDGKSIPVTTEKFVPGYGAPTLVFKPEINKSTLPEKASFDVKVTLSDGRNYSYTVNTFAYDPNR